MLVRGRERRPDMARRCRARMRRSRQQSGDEPTPLNDARTARVDPKRTFPTLRSSNGEATDKDKRTIERAAARGETLGDDLDAIASAFEF